MIQDLLADPDFGKVMSDVGTRLFEPVGNRPRLLQALDRFVAKSTRFTPYVVKVAQVPILICERDPTRVALWIYNNGPNTIFIGTHSVTNGATLGDPDAGYPILNQGQASIGSVAAEIWAISTTGTNDVRVVDLAG
jgi:hypothetical protein